MLATFTSVSYNSTLGTYQIILKDSNINSYTNSVIQFESANRIGIPKAGQLVNIEEEGSTQLQVTGYQNSLVDANWIPCTYGESTTYSNSWYYTIRNSGIEAQEANTPNIENFMMGQSTNAVLLDIMNLLTQVVTWLGTHEHLPGDMVVGSDPVTGNSGIPTTTVPSDTDVTNDITYITDNKNLAITGTYEPK